MSNYHSVFKHGALSGLLLGLACLLPPHTVQATDVDLANVPLFLGANGTPLSLLVMGRDHKLYYEAYNDASDVNGDGQIDVGYKPNLKDPTRKDSNGNPLPLDYYGYFDSHKCYSYDSGVFTPTQTTTTKKCPGSWSGDFLNYLTSSRMDALRRVLYGGSRSTDDDTATILERSYIPQDAHSWGKEYESEARDGYLISDYTPLAQPATGTFHLFANTTLLCPSGNSDPGCNSNSGLPLLRVLTNSDYRVWEWLSIERPVAGVQCATGNDSRANCATGAGGNYDSYPNNHLDYEALVKRFAKPDHLQSTTDITTINKPNDTGDYYLTVIIGTLKVTNAGDYEISVDGDDAVEVIVDNQVVAGWYGGHGNCGTATSCRDAHKGSITLSSGDHTLVFRHQERQGGDNYFLYWKGQDSLGAWQIVPATSLSGLVQKVYDVKTSASTMTDYVVRVKACVDGLLETECLGYPADTPTVHKPIGLLQTYGATDRMAFGLLTGSYTNNLSGGVIRKNMSSLSDEVDSNTGKFSTSVEGVIDTINKLKIYGFGAKYFHHLDCTVPEVGPMAQGRCRMWGNPIAEMMYEGLRYFAGKSTATSAFSTGVDGSDTDDTALGLPLPAWQNPYRTTGGGYQACSKPFELVISDINPSFDTDQLPGSNFSPTTNPNTGASITGDLSGLNVKGLADTIWGKESEGTNVFIGQSGTTYDGAPTPKTVTSFGDIRGLTPEEPTRQGGFYAGSVAFYGKTNDLNSVAGKQTVDTFSVALASPLPSIKIPIQRKTVTLVPFGKSVGGGNYGIDATQGKFQPTNTIVDFYVDTLKNMDTDTAGNVINQDTSVNGGRASGKFRINFEDSEYGSDHDMDAIVLYEFKVKADGTLEVKLSSDYAKGDVIQHMGYVISGTTQDGVYLEVRDSDTGAGSDVDYFLDTPNLPPAAAQLPGGAWNDGKALPLQATRTFTPGATPSAVFIKHDPLWYAAKWGGFIDKNNNGIPDGAEWDADNDGVPDTYFLVTNAGRLKEQLTKAFEEITKRTSSAAAVAVNTGSLNTSSRIYQARFNTSDWSGELLSYRVNTDGTPGIVDWNAADTIKTQDSSSDRKIITYKPSTKKGIAFRWPSNSANPGTTELDTAQITSLIEATGTTETEKAARLNYLRGSKADEGINGKQYRPRNTQLGDIINSNPFYAGVPALRYRDDLEGVATGPTAYSQFRFDQKDRKAMVYVGANDGLLHAFDATTGLEKLAYVPSSSFTGLSELTSPDYNTAEHHLYFVDGSPTVGDAFYSSAWHTVLIGSLRKGGRGFFALDVTNPDNFIEASAASLALWEFTSGDDADLGFSFSQPSIVRMHNDKWAAIFGNGYNSTNTGHAILFIVDIATGAIIEKIDTTPSASKPATPNGLATPSAVDVDGDNVVDYIYAGDLSGNLWRFDVTSSSTSSWTSSLLFTAQDSTGKAQPITTSPEVIKHPDSGYIVLFGTGKYLGKSDVSTTDPQSFYGIRDSNGALVSGSDPGSHRTTFLQQQTFSTDTDINGKTFRTSSLNAVDWSTKKGWFIDLPVSRERMVSDPLLPDDRIIFTSIVPAENPCDFGGKSYINILDAVTGQRAPETFLNASTGGVPIKDTSGNAPSSLQIGGIASSSTMMTADKQINLYTSSSTGVVEGTPVSGKGYIGRLTWRQMEFQQ